MCEFDVERMESAIERWFLCKGEIVASGRGFKDVSFIFDKGGVITVRLMIGDPEAPAYRLKLLFRRPEQQRRSGFRDEFAYNVDHTKGEQGKIETVINLKQGVGFTDEHFLGISTEPDTKLDGTIVYYSEVVFSDTRSVEERVAAGEAPRPVSAVEADETIGGGTQEQPEDVSFIPYTEALRSRFLQSFHPMYKVEAAATAISSFKSISRD
jgi:hypothetical protein